MWPPYFGCGETCFAGQSLGWVKGLLRIFSRIIAIVLLDAPPVAQDRKAHHVEGSLASSKSTPMQPQTECCKKH